MGIGNQVANFDLSFPLKSNRLTKFINMAFPSILFMLSFMIGNNIVD